MPETARTLSSKTIYKGKIVELKVDRVIEPEGVEATREVVCHLGSVVVVPHLPGERLVLVRQYRYAVNETLWELVAGGLNGSESPLDAARRELCEEAGYQPGRVESRLDFFPSPGILTEKMHLVEAWDLVAAPGVPDEDERIEVGIFAIKDILAMIKRGEIHDAKTLVGILLLFGNGGSLELP